MTASTTTPSAQPFRKAPLFTPYVVVWSMFGALSFGFLMVLGLAPEWLDDLRPAATFSDPQSNQGQRAAARMAADIGELKDSVAQVHLELAKIKTDVAMQGAQQKSVADQLTSLEARISGSLPAAALETSSPAVEAVKPSPTDDGGDRSAIKSPVKTLKVINANPAAGAALETGSVSGQTTHQATQMKTAKPQVATDQGDQMAAFDTAITKTTPGPVGIKISTGASVDTLRLSWGLLSEKHRDALDNLEPRYTEGGDASNPTYDLVAGPVPSRADAVRICKTLTQRGVACTVGGFSGEAL